MITIIIAFILLFLILGIMGSIVRFIFPILLDTLGCLGRLIIFGASIFLVIFLIMAIAMVLGF